ncbi:MAG: hypothetical protein JWM59_737 [Verrucomicrobiales bacterium]|nr:hypothetical protein [Verrucomicrobiales bacterium]
MRSPALLFLAALMLSGCGSVHHIAAKSRQKKEKKQLEKLIATSAADTSSRLGQKAVGEIAAVGEDSQYVLMRLRTGISLPANTELESRRGGTRTALLRMTPERKNIFTIADLTEGAPQAGDSLFLSKAKSSIPQPLTAGAPVLSAAGEAAVSAGTAAPGTDPAIPADQQPLLPPPSTGAFPAPPTVPDDDGPTEPIRILKLEDVLGKQRPSAGTPHPGGTPPPAK